MTMQTKKVVGNASVLITGVDADRVRMINDVRGSVVGNGGVVRDVKFSEWVSEDVVDLSQFVVTPESVFRDADGVVVGGVGVVQPVTVVSEVPVAV